MTRIFSAAKIRLFLRRSIFAGLVTQVYTDLGFEDVSVKLALRPDTRAGDDEVWDRAEGGLREALTAVGSGMGRTAGRGGVLRPEN
jgi:threonyl-tRNA synthetase